MFYLLCYIYFKQVQSNDNYFFYVQGDQVHVIPRNQEFDVSKLTLQEHYTYMVYNGDPLINDLPLKVYDNFILLNFLFFYSFSQ